MQLLYGLVFENVILSSRHGSELSGVDATPVGPMWRQLFTYCGRPALSVFTLSGAGLGEITPQCRHNKTLCNPYMALDTLIVLISLLAGEVLDTVLQYRYDKFKNAQWEVTGRSVFSKVRLHEVTGPFQTVHMAYTDSLTYRYNLFVLRMCFLNMHHDNTIFTGMRRIRLIEIMHRLCCEQFYIGTIYFLPNHTAGMACRKRAFTQGRGACARPWVDAYFPLHGVALGRRGIVPSWNTATTVDHLE